MKRAILTAVVLTVVGALLLWAPWLTEAAASQRVVDQFESNWQGIIDGCGFSCQGCGAKDAWRVVGGYRIEIEYACGMLPSDSPEFHLTETAFVSSLGTVHGLNQP